MIGQKIIQFDNAEISDVATFEEIFNIDLKADKRLEVEIGELTTGDLREVFVGGIKELIDLSEEGRTSTHKTARRN